MITKWRLSDLWLAYQWASSRPS